MPKSFLAWPVRLLGVDEELHVTLKYLGDTRVVLTDMQLRLYHTETRIDIARCGWSPETFGPGVPVLELFGLPEHANACRALVNDLRPDDYPKWRPHISFSSTLTRDYAAQHKPKRIVLETGPLIWYVDKKPYFAFK